MYAHVRLEQRIEIAVRSGQICLQVRPFLQNSADIGRILFDQIIQRHQPSCFHHQFHLIGGQRAQPQIHILIASQHQIQIGNVILALGPLDMHIGFFFIGEVHSIRRRIGHVGRKRRKSSQCQFFIHQWESVILRRQSRRAAQEHHQRQHTGQQGLPVVFHGKASLN